MATAPLLPADEAPLDQPTIDRFLRTMSSEMVLVGGQALAFWMNRYGIPSGGAMISNDGDALGEVRHARRLAAELRSALVLPKPDALTGLVAQLRIPVTGGKVRNVDVLHLLYTISGLKKSNEFTKRVQRDAVPIRAPEGFEFRVMHPLDLLESRAHNAVGLVGEKGDHVVTQARWAIEVVRKALAMGAANPQADPKRLGASVQRILRLWKASVGQRLWKEHGLCVLDAVDREALLTAQPQLRAQLKALDQARPPAA